MILLKLTGGVGNQLFQYAAGRCLALRLKTDLLLDTDYYLFVRNRHYVLDQFRIRATRMLPAEGRIRRTISSYQHIVEQKYFSFDPSFHQLNGNIYLDGWWQNPIYFKSDRKKILQELQLNDLRAKKLEKNSVSIHIRRGDYTALSGFGVCSPRYYKQAIQQIQKKVTNPVFYVCSDDRSWVEENLPFLPNPVWGDHTSELEDLSLMSRCTHHILANSTFSWWGATLAQEQKGITIAPSPWVNYEKKETKALYEKNWIILARN